MIQRLSVRTRSKAEFRDITSQVQELVRSSGIDNGICYVFVPHTTAGVTVNEHADPSVAEDIETQLNRMVPQGSDYRHLEGNAPAHIKSVLVGNSETLLVDRGKLWPESLSDVSDSLVSNADQR